MIVVEPAALLVAEHLEDDGPLVDGSERQRLEPEEAAKLGLHGGNDQQGVLYAHTETTGQIGSGCRAGS